MLILLLFFINALSADEWNCIHLATGEWKESTIDLVSKDLELKREFYSISRNLSAFAQDWHFNLPDFGSKQIPRHKMNPPSNKFYNYKYDQQGRLIYCALIDEMTNQTESWFEMIYHCDQCTVRSDLDEVVTYGLKDAHLTYVEKANGERCEYTYISHPQEHKCLLTEKKEKDCWIKLKYDENNKIKEIIGSKDGGETFNLVCHLEYTSHTTIATDAKNVVNKHHYNRLFQVEKIETFLPDGVLYRVQEFEWHQNHLVRKTIKDGDLKLLQQQRMIYDVHDNLIQEFLEGTLTEAGNEFESIEKKYSYDEKQRLIQEELEELTIAYIYDGDSQSPSYKTIMDNGSIVETAPCSAEETARAPEEISNSPNTCTYDCFGRKVTETTPVVLGPDDTEEQWTTTYIYDALDRIIETINPDQQSKKALFNARGQPLLIDYPDGTFEERFYSLSGRLKKEVNRDKTYVLYEWDGLGRLKSRSYYSQNGECIKSHICLYQGSQLYQEIFSSGIIIEYHYDEEGRKNESVNLTTGRKVSYTYDDEGKLCQEKDWIDTESFIERSIESTSSIENSQEQFEWVINDRGQTVRQSKDSSKGLLILYDALNRIERIENGHLVRHLRHNYQGKKIKEILEYPDHKIIHRWIYDHEGRLLVQIEAEGSIDERKTYYNYTMDGKLESLYEPSGVKLQYVYNALGKLSNLFSSDGTIDYELHYTKEGHIKTVYDHITGLISEREYNSEGQLVKEKLANGLVLQNTYDLIGRRRSLVLPDLSRILYHFDKEQLQAIERTGKTLPPKASITDKAPELDLVRPDLLEYDLAGNLIKKVSHGNIFLFSYDALHRLTSVKKNDEEVHCYIYDLFHRRLIDTISKHSFIYDGNWEIGSMYDGKIEELRILEPSRSFEHGLFVSLEIEGLCYKPKFDSQGNLTALFDAEGTSVDASLSPWQFAGKRLDPLTGMIHFGRRDYDPELGKFITPDPFGFIDGPDKYAYLPQDFFGLKTMSENWEDFKQSTLEFFEGLKDKILNTFQVIKDSHSIKISQVFETMFGPGFILLGGFRPTESESGVYGKGELNDKVRVSFTNGILTDKGYLFNTLKSLSECHGNVNIHYVYRPTRGWVYDILHSFAVGVGLVSEQAEKLAKEWRQMIQEMGSGGKIIHYAHSIGTIESERALGLLTEEEQKLVHIYAFGSPNLAEGYPDLQIHHFVSIHDGVCLLNLIGYIKACRGSISNVVFTGSLVSIPFVDHLFGNQSYQDIWKSMGRTFTEWYGTL